MHVNMDILDKDEPVGMDRVDLSIRQIKFPCIRVPCITCTPSVMLILVEQMDTGVVSLCIEQCVKLGSGGHQHDSEGESQEGKCCFGVHDVTVLLYTDFVG